MNKQFTPAAIHHGHNYEGVQEHEGGASTTIGTTSDNPRGDVHHNSDGPNNYQPNIHDNTVILPPASPAASIPVCLQPVASAGFSEPEPISEQEPKPTTIFRTVTDTQSEAHYG